MGLIDAFGREDRVEIPVSTLFAILKEGAKTELIMNAVNCNVPHGHIREMATGKKEPGYEIKMTERGVTFQKESGDQEETYEKEFSELEAAGKENSM